MSDRRLIGLLSNLPPEASTKQALYGADPGSRWSQTDYLLASVLDALNSLVWVTVKAHSETYEEPPPEPVYRPVVIPEPEVIETPLSDMGSWLSQIGTVPDGG